MIFKMTKSDPKEYKRMFAYLPRDFESKNGKCIRIWLSIFERGPWRFGADLPVRMYVATERVTYKGEEYFRTEEMPGVF